MMTPTIPKEAKAKISTFKRLPVLPAILVRLIEACNDENVSLQSIASLIGTDAGLTSRVLFLANSAYYGSYNPIEHIDQAVFRMGKRTLKSVVLSAAVHQVFKGKYGFEGEVLQKFWRHCLLTALLSRQIAEKMGQGDGDQAFFAGLIHDMGRLVLSANYPEEYRELISMEDGEEILLAQESKIAAPHPEVAAWLLEKWKVDSLIVDAVFYHHESVKRIAEAFPLVKILYGAHILACMTESNHVRCDPAMELLGLSPEDTTSLLVKAEEELEKVAESLGLDIGKVATLKSKVEEMAHMFAPLEAMVAARREEEIITAIFQSVRVLCDVSDVILLVLDAEGRHLVSYGDPFLRTFRVPVGQVSGLLSRSLKLGDIVTSFDEPKETRSIMDEQLMHRLGEKGLVLVPLVSMGERIGTIIFGLDQEGRETLDKSKSLLKVMSSIAASALMIERMKREEQKKIQEEKLRTIHQFMRRIAHEINNPLSIIKNFLAILSSRLGQHGEVNREIQIIREEIDRMGRILAELSIDKMDKGIVRTRINVNTVVEELISLFRPLANQRGIKLEIKVDPTLPDIYADRDGLKQMVINLLKNSIEAVSAGGHVNLETKLEQSGEPGNYRQHVVISVSDDGPGIPASVKANLFEPMVSTKGKGHSGIGLSVVYQVVKSHGGEITCETGEDKGTRFVIRLPLMEDGL